MPLKAARSSLTSAPAPPVRIGYLHRVSVHSRNGDAHGPRADVSSQVGRPAGRAEALTMTSSQITMTIRFDRSSGSTQLVRTVDEVDLPWLLQLVDDLRVEGDALMTLVAEGRDDRLLIRVRQGHFRVERTGGGTGAHLVRQDPTSAPAPTSAAALVDGRAEVDAGAARAAVESVLCGRPLAPGLGWS